MTADSMIDYEALAQEAMRNVVRSVLTEAAAKGLPGDHHFYISFDTLAPGVILSKRLREKYAEEMTIVLQHRFWDLIVTDARFEVKLTFDGIPERLVVPFKAIRVFFDPSVRYGLQFESVNTAPEGSSSIELNESFDDPFANRDFKRPTPSAVPAMRDTTSLPPRKVIAPVKATADEQGDGDKTDVPVSEPEYDATGTEEAEAGRGGAEIVSLDAFRKK